MNAARVDCFAHGTSHFRRERKDGAHERIRSEAA
ncbi:hypothetical protein MPOCJGCO_1708 [Methylobacterium trifolii]|uniref:Uncharacterized protein n=1 Tax=Methylobacterium trifolii TaxID=1003092 RepID=A0ABQ4TWH8_9HYPH|nr:hypothetical protein MPOCJGCO_1708 [Methylobacterium trifolii]